MSKRFTSSSDASCSTLLFGSLFVSVLLRRIFFLLLLVCWISDPARAGDITLDVLVESRDDVVTIAVTNTGRDDAHNVFVRLQLHSYSSEFPIADVIAPQKKRFARHSVRLPPTEGSFPLISTVFYLNDKQRMSVVNVGHFYVGQRRELDVDCRIDDRQVALDRRASISLPKNPGQNTRLVLPAELSLESVTEDESFKHFTVANLVEGLRANYQIYAIHQDDNNGLRICSGRLTTSATPRPQLPIPHWSLLITAAWGLLLACFFFRRMSATENVSIDAIAAIRYGTSLMLASLVLLFYLEARVLADYFLPYIYSVSSSNMAVTAPLAVLRFGLTCLYFDGANYFGFFNYFAFPIFLYMLLGNVWVLRYLILPHSLRDKYWFLYLPLLQRLTARRVSFGGKDVVSENEGGKLRRVAMLSSLVKSFYVPLVTSWVYNEYVFVSGLHTLNFSDFNAVNHAAIRTLISIDVAIFAFGYLSELPQLNNKIRSVENTLLGWVVCLMCYPPFNYVSFFPVDYELFDTWNPVEGTYAKVASFSIMLLWAVYAWASVALGARASNLTNRGIVSTGPYRYVRHPAYSSKVVLWAISGYFLGIYNFFLIVGFIFVYSLRAWTEERHLRADPDYHAYCEKVKYKFIPFIF